MVAMLSATGAQNMAMLAQPRAICAHVVAKVAQHRGKSAQELEKGPSLRAILTQKEERQKAGYAIPDRKALIYL